MKRNLLLFFVLSFFVNVKSQVNLEANYFTLNHYWSDSFLCSVNRSGNYHLIGTYPGWDTTAIYIAGYNNTNMASVLTKRVFVGQNIKFDLAQNSLDVGSLNTQGLLIGRYKDGLNWDGTGAQPGYHIRFAGFRDVANECTGARISAFRTNFCCNGLSQGMELAFSVTPSIAGGSSGDVNLNEAMRINDNGNVAIGKVRAEATLDVAGTIKAQEIQVTLASADSMHLNGALSAENIRIKTNGQTADFVFADDYQLRELEDVAQYVKENNHLPDIPSAEEMEKMGVDLAEMNKLLLQKIEELTLYTIYLEKKDKVKEVKIEILNTKLNELENLKTEMAEFKALMFNRSIKCDNNME